jgi:molecular chaperone GrpE
MNPNTREQLLSWFESALRQTPDSVEPPDSNTTLSLHTLLAEMAALKNDVRLQTRHFKSTLDQLQTLSLAQQQHTDQLHKDLAQAREQISEIKTQTQRPLLLGVLELRDRLQASLDTQVDRPASFMEKRFGGQSHRFAQSLREGSELILQRFDELLANYRVRPIAVLGQKLDAQCMHAVATQADPSAEQGVVLREVRRGFYQGDILLRVAQVIVNKFPPNHESVSV